MIDKKYIKSRKKYKVTFAIPKTELPEGLEVESVAVVGDFNDWDGKANRLKATKKGVYKGAVEVEPEESYRFRYLANGEYWFNAWQADGYQSNEYDTDDCVLSTVSGEIA